MSHPEIDSPITRTVRRELIAIALMASAALIFVSLYTSAAGAVGAVLSRWFRAAFGQSAAVPALFLFASGIAVVRRTKRPGRLRRVLSITLIYLVLLAGYHLLVTELVGPFSSFWARRIGEEGLGGGYLGGFLAARLLVAFGSWGSIVVLSALFLVGVTLLLETPIARVASSIARVFVRLITWVGTGVWQFTLGVKDEIAELIGNLQDRRKRAAALRAESVPPPKPRRQPEPSPAGAPKAPKAERRVRPTPKPVERAGMEASAGVDPAPEEAPLPAGEEKADDGDANLQLALPSSPQFYRLPDVALLDRPREASRGRRAQNPDQSALLEETLATFGVSAKVVQVSHGPVITRYELQPAPGVKVSRIVNLADDVSLNLAAAGVRIEAPVPGKSVVGIEVPNKERSVVHFREVVESPEFRDHPSKLVAALGKDIAGKPVIADLTKLLHLLIAGATGSGKSVCINTLICSILFKARPDEVKLLMIDPKRVELAVYDGIPHLITPVVTDPKLAANALRWAVKEMENRYKRFSEEGVRNIDGYNKGVESGRIEGEKLPYIAVIVDELADLMLVAGNDVEDSICRLAQMARAAGIHLVIATQRPSVDVITGLIKANVPSRLSFAVSSGIDSRTILDMMGAERLIGKGDMLYYPIGANKPLRAQGALITDREVQAVVESWKRQGEPEFVESVTESAKGAETIEEGDDELFDDAVRLVVETGNASISMVQRRFRVGYARAARLIDMMELAGIVGPYQGSKPREVLKTLDDLEDSAS